MASVSGLKLGREGEVSERARRARSRRSRDRPIDRELEVGVDEFCMVFAVGPTQENFKIARQRLLDYETALAFLDEKREANLCEATPLGWGLHEWAVLYALNPSALMDATQLIQNSMLVTAFMLAFLVPEVYEPKLITDPADDWVRLVIDSLNFIASSLLLVCIVMGLAFLDATAAKPYLPIEKHFMMMRFFSIVGIQQFLYLTGIVMTCVGLALVSSAHTNLSVAKEVVFVTAAVVMLLLLIVPYLIISSKGGALQKARTNIFIEYVLDRKTFFVQQRWHRALDYLIWEAKDKYPSADQLSHMYTAFHETQSSLSSSSSSMASSTMTSSSSLCPSG